MSTQNTVFEFNRGTGQEAVVVTITAGEGGKMETRVAGLPPAFEKMPGHEAAPDFYFDVRDALAHFAASMFEAGRTQGFREGMEAKGAEIRKALGL